MDPHRLDPRRRNERVEEVVALGHVVPVDEGERGVSAGSQHRTLQPQELTRQGADPVDDLPGRDLHLAGHAQGLGEGAQTAGMGLAAGGGDQPVGANSHGGPAEELLHGGLVAVVGDDAHVAPVDEDEVEDGLVGLERVHVLTAEGPGHVAEALAQEVVADAGQHLGDADAVEAAAEPHEVVPGGGVGPHLVVGGPAAVGVEQAGQELLPAAGADLGGEEDVAGGGPRRPRVHVLHGGDHAGGVVDLGRHRLELVPVAAAGDLGVLVAVAAAAVHRGADHLVEGGEDQVALRPDVGEQRGRADLVEGPHQLGELALVGVDGRVVDQPGGQPQGEGGLAAHHLGHVPELLVAGLGGHVAHDRPAHRAVAQVQAHVGDRAAPVPAVELLGRGPSPLAVDGAVEGLELGRVLLALVGGHRGRGQAVHPADALDDPAPQGQLAGQGDAVGADAGSGQGAVVVGVDEAGAQHPVAAFDGGVGGAGLRRRHRAQPGDPVAVDQGVALVGLGSPIAVDDHRAADQLPHRDAIPLSGSTGGGAESPRINCLIGDSP